MTTRMHNVTFDCADPVAQAAFWSQVTGFAQHPDNGADPEDTETLLLPPGDGPGILFQRVPEGRAVKNRLHLDLRPTDGTRDEEVQRLLGIGATLVLDMRQPDGTGWVQLADPEGNEFCVERGNAERGE